MLRVTAIALLMLCGCSRGSAPDPPVDTGVPDRVRGSQPPARDQGARSFTNPAAGSGDGAEASLDGESTGWGNLKGKFVYDGKAPEPLKFDTSKEPLCGKHNLVDESLVVGEDGGLANVVVYVRDKKVKVHADYEATADDTLRFDNHNCRFEPHVMPIRLSQTMELHNSDTFSHNSNLQPIGDTAINPLISMGGKVTYQFRRAQNVPVSVSCNIHSWMKGWIIPRDNPYVAVSAEDGTFAIANLPAGELEFQVWQEKAGYLAAKKEWKTGRFKLKIKDGDNDLGQIKVSPNLFEKK